MKATVLVGWDDVPHLSKDKKDTILASTPPWQRDARTKGIPELGKGAVFTIPESDIVVTGFDIPKHWPRAYGLDVGWNRTAAVWGAIDRDTGSVYIYDEYYRGQAEPSVHAAAIKSRGDWIPGAIDPASRGRTQTDGAQLLELYTQLGLHVDIAYNVREAGIYTVWEMLSQGRLKIFNHCKNVMAEYRIYRRDEKGQVVKKNDHLMDALRYFVMTGMEIAKVQPTGRADGRPWWYWSPPEVWAG